MAELRDLDSGKIYIGPVEPNKEDRSDETLNGNKPFDGTLAVTGPAFIGSHSKKARGLLNVGTDLGDFSPKVAGRAVDIEGDVAIEGNTTQRGNTFTVGKVTVDGPINASSTITSSSQVTAAGHKLTAKKDFDIPHPNIEGYRLRHTCVEGPEAAIYVRGKVSIDGIIDLPDYWQNFVDKDSISVHLTPFGAYQELFVEKIEYGKRIFVRNQAGGKIDAYYQVWADRAGEKLIVEYKGSSAADYPGDQSDHSVAGYNYDIRDDDDRWFTSDV